MSLRARKANSEVNSRELDSFKGQSVRLLLSVANLSLASIALISKRYLLHQSLKPCLGLAARQ